MINETDLSTRRRATTPKPFVFVLMPFDSDFNDIYRLGIKAACEKAGAYCERVDEQFYQESILQRVYNQIAKADLIVADMTGRNPNVFYEVGYAHALGKDVVLLTRSAEDIPFDLKHHHHIIYDQGISALLDKLSPRVRWSLSQLEATGEIPETPRLQFFVAGNELADGSELILHLPSPSEIGLTTLEINVHNPGPQAVELGPGALAAVVPSNIKIRSSQGIIRLPDGRLHCELPPVGRLLPSSWRSTTLGVILEQILIEDSAEDSDDPYSNLSFESEKMIAMELRHYQEYGVRVISVPLKLLTTLA